MNPDTLMALKVGTPALLILAAPFVPWMASRWGRRREWARTAAELGALPGGGYRRLTMDWSGDDGLEMTAAASDGQTLSASVTGPLPQEVGFMARGRLTPVGDRVGDPVFAEQVTASGETAQLLAVLDHTTRMKVAAATRLGWRLEAGALVFNRGAVAHKHAETRTALTVGTGLATLLAATKGTVAERLEQRAADDPLPSVRARALVELGPAARERLVDTLREGALDDSSATVVTAHLAAMVGQGHVDKSELVAVGQSLLQSDAPTVRRSGAALLEQLGHAIEAGGLTVAEVGAAEGELALAKELQGGLSPASTDGAT